MEESEPAIRTAEDRFEDSEGHLGIDVGSLKHVGRLQADMPHGGRRQLTAAAENPPRVMRRQSVEESEQCRLASAVGTDERPEFPAADSQADIVQNLAAPKTHAHMAEFRQHRSFGGRHARSPQEPKRQR